MEESTKNHIKIISLIAVPFLLLGIFLGQGLYNWLTGANYVDIKYRDNNVNVADSRFEHLDTSNSSFIRDAWYDSSNQYMVIDLNGTKYHYCEMPEQAWSSFKRAQSFGSHYNNKIKGNYDCRINRVPDY